MRTGFAVCLLLAVAAILPAEARADWPASADTNLVICARTSDQVTPKVAATSDGGCFVSWYDLSSGNYNVNLQRLDSNGVVLWENCGIVVDGHSQDTWITDFDMKVDAEDCAIVAMNDTRTDPNRDEYAYRVSSTGEMLWGADGIHLSAEGNANFEPGPLIAVTTGGNVAFAWQEGRTAGSVINIRKVTAAGADVWNPSTVTFSIPSGYGLSIPRIIAAPNDEVIIEYLLQTGNFNSPRSIYAQKLDSLGNPVWAGPMPISLVGNLGIQMFPSFAPDDSGGGYCYWYDAHDANRHHCYVQHILSDGSPAWTVNGVQLSLSSAQIQMSPTFCRVPHSSDVMAFYMTSNSGQTAWGVGGQRLSAAGQRMWGDDGLSFADLNDQQRYLVQAFGQDSGATVVYFEYVTGSAVNSQVRAFRVNLAGTQVWDPSPRDVCSVVSSKSYLHAGVNRFGQVIAAWSDQRSSTSGDLYLQNINPDGSLGNLTTPPPPSPTLTITSPQDSVEVMSLPLTVSFSTEHFVVADSGGNGLVAVYLNGSLVEFHGNPNPLQLADLVLGINTIILELVDYAHQPLSPAVRDSVHVNYTVDAADPFNLSPTSFSLSAYPNPFNPLTTLRVALPTAQRVRLAVYDILGRQVALLADGTQSAGNHRFTFDGSALAAGVYFCRLDAGPQTRLQKLMLLK